ncbi:MAG: FmdE family protein [Spirochaetaceae bacterium]|jgi:formylmethanofuran dehydrogenase subunit E|nr:FmdE family protein [Spirochaetaceae bacterium]
MNAILNASDGELWERSVEFHGHSCPGLAIGYKAAVYARELLGLGFSQDEEFVCVTETDACGVDAISVVLGCSVGKGNLLFKLRGKQAFSFFNRNTGKSVRLVTREAQRNGRSREEAQRGILAAPCGEMFDVKTPSFGLPENARVFNSFVCECCGEKTAENYLRFEDGKKVCLDCFSSYSRFM